jgi:hypothetical protein
MIDYIAACLSVSFVRTSAGSRTDWKIIRDFFQSKRVVFEASDRSNSNSFRRDRSPHLKRLLHPWVSKERQAHLALHRPVNDAMQITTPRDLRSRNLKLWPELCRILDRRAVHHAIQHGP